MFDIKWEFVKVNGELEGLIEYRDELFDDNYIFQFESYFIKAIKEITVVKEKVM
ncbi:hypothetical protein [Lactococcus lactis]|uniref:hypothetical protein n=1 Tax=Lactococcus lactis TaxID=1358 RepID=UPI00163DE4E3|nr:hypothetical protein [Lactococcus lactis]